jgi:general secretion pathway protein G
MVCKGNQKGFTLIEVIVVAGIIAILAGILVPMIMNQVDEAKIARAQGDIKSVQGALMNFKRDTGSWPVKTADPAVTVSILYTDSTSTATPPIPTMTDPNWTVTTPARLADHLGSDANNVYGSTWKGPYMSTMAADPWGNAYVINAAQFNTNRPVWIMSAGPDGILQSGPLSDICNDKNATPPGDDICLRIK